ncbi:hypothetical protein QFZ82_004257 [Streptomyces sp. V4I23]|uniref:DUF2797 domain-containing protein n=1 Tax=Streptomyces sp. V4I23 TaxID=3042282 RepID=UPI0027899001|nr:DUF2797 domain-containing protein [Streptomyces sp. V4I23]MDQ1009772.1 hypothetical protein [Streptomyces sp. V4I23]
MAWRCAGVAWPDGGPGAVLRWEGGRVSPLGAGREIGFCAMGERHCVGARGNACPLRARVSARAAQARCPECARLDRAHSVAADAVPDDPRIYRVYLAWFGPGMVKVGITAEERGAARLLEQGAVAFSWLGRGPLMAARRTEELLRAALGVPDRIPYGRKRAVRTALPPVAERAGEVEELHARAVALGGWAGSLERMPCEVVDHAAVFGLDGLPAATGVVRELVDGGVVAGRLLAAAGPDLHLRTAAGRVVVVDTRLMTGWSLVGADPGAEVSVPLTAVPAGSEQDGLF